jgi:hypothetical protein
LIFFLPSGANEETTDLVVVTLLEVIGEFLKFPPPTLGPPLFLSDFSYFEKSRRDVVVNPSLLFFLSAFE